MPSYSGGGGGLRTSEGTDEKIGKLRSEIERVRSMRAGPQTIADAFVELDNGATIDRRSAPTRLARRVRLR